MIRCSIAVSRSMKTFLISGYYWPFFDGLMVLLFISCNINCTICKNVSICLSPVAVMRLSIC